MKVLMVTDFYPPYRGGLESAVRDLSRELGTGDVHVVVATLGGPGLPDKEQDGPVRVRRLQGATHGVPFLFRQPERRYHPPLPDPVLLARLGRLIAEERPDVVHGHSWMMLSALPLKRRFGFAAVYTLHDYSLVCPKKSLLHDERRPCPYHLSRHCLPCASQSYGGLKGAAVTAGLALGRNLYREVDVFLALSRYSRDVHLRDGPAAKATVVTVPQILPASLLDDPPGPRLPDLPDDYILFAGVLSHHKGLHVLLEAYRRLAVDVPLVLIGPDRPDTPGQLPPGVVMYPAKANDDVIRAMDHSRFVVGPSVIPEVASRVVLEAMARGKAVVASRGGGTPEMVQDGETGLLVEPGDAEGLRCAMAGLLSAPDRAERMGRAAALQCRERFSPSAVVDRTLDAYRLAISRCR